MSSSSDSEPDENTKVLLASVDTTFYSDKMYKEKNNSDGEQSIEGPKLKSNRYIENVEEIFHSDINVPESMKRYVGQKFSEMVSQQVEFVDFEQRNGASVSEIEESPGVQLLKGAPVLDLNKDPNPDLPEMSKKPIAVKKRVLEDDSLSEGSKFVAVAVDSETLLSGKETKHWKSRQKSKIFDYKTKNGVGYFREPVTELE